MRLFWCHDTNKKKLAAYLHGKMDQCFQLSEPAMPAKIPADIIERAVALYISGYSSIEAGHAVGVSASVVAEAVRGRGLIRTISESKKLAYKRHPPALTQVDHNKIYIKSSEVERTCASCGKLLPATTEHFYRRKRDNGRSYLSSSCKPCVRADRADYRRSHPEKTKETSRKSRAKNGHKHYKQKALSLLFVPEVREKNRERNRRWLDKNKDHVIIYRQAHRAENKDAIKKRNKRWYENNQSKVRASRANRKARKKLAEGSFSQRDIELKIEAQNGQCYWCKIDLHDYHIDHFIPLKKGGSNWPSNIVVACPTCNVSRGAKSAEEFHEYLEFIKNNAEQIDARRAYMREAMRKHRAKKKTATSNEGSDGLALP